jgi:hypothetical protein
MSNERWGVRATWRVAGRVVTSEWREVTRPGDAVHLAAEWANSVTPPHEIRAVRLAEDHPDGTEIYGVGFGAHQHGLDR